MNSSAFDRLSEHARSTLALHGMLGILAGLVGGMVFLFQILGYIEIFPIVPRIEAKPPGTEAAWHAGHIGPLLNGLLAVGIAAIGGLLRLGAKAQRRLVAAMLLTVWGNTIGYFASALGGERGLHFGGGTGNLIAYCSFLVAALAVFVAVILVIVGLVRGRRAQAGS